MLRQFFSVVAFLATVGVTAAATVEVVRQAVSGLAPVTIDGQVYARDAHRDGIFGPLLEYQFELSGDRHQKRVLLDVLEERLSRGGNLAAEWQALSPEERQIVQRNLAALGPVWLADRSEEYHRLPRQLRERYLDQQLEQMLHWAALYSAVGSQDLRSLRHDIDLDQVRWDLEVWLRRLDPQQREQHLAFLQALRQRVSRGRSFKLEFPLGAMGRISR